MTSKSILRENPLFFWINWNKGHNIVSTCAISKGFGLRRGRKYSYNRRSLWRFTDAHFPSCFIFLLVHPLSPSIFKLAGNVELRSRLLRRYTADPVTRMSFSSDSFTNGCFLLLVHLFWSFNISFSSIFPTPFISFVVNSSVATSASSVNSKRMWSIKNGVLSRSLRMWVSSNISRVNEWSVPESIDLIELIPHEGFNHGALHNAAVFGYVIVDRLCHRADETVVKCPHCENQTRFGERRSSDPVQSRTSSGWSFLRTSIRFPACRAVTFHAACLAVAVERSPING